jgi:hypothetical protein
MGDPELRSDEKILMRTPGVYVKSIPFEGILTNKRVILVDRATNLIPPKEIPLVTIKDIESGENAIRDPIIKLSVLTKSSEKRQMILTFSRQTGGNRIKERDTWLKTMKEQTSSTFDQVIRKVIPGFEQAPKKPEKGPSPRIEVTQSPMIKPVPAAEKPSGPKSTEGISKVKKIIQISPSLDEPVAEKSVSGPESLQLGTYCSRCGNRVPEGSGFCNRCGSKIFVPGSGAGLTTQAAAKSTQPAEESAPVVPQVEKKSKTSEPLMEPSAERIEPWVTVRKEPVIAIAEEPAFYPDESAAFTQDVPGGETEESPASAQPFILASREPEYLPPPKTPPGGTGFKPGKKTVIGIIAIIIIIAVILGGFFLFPMIANGSSSTSGDGASHTPLPTIVKNSGNSVIPAKSLNPTVKPTYPAGPGNSPSNTGY